MSWLKGLFSRKALVRSLQVVCGIIATYIVCAVGLVFWPSPSPFGDETPIVGEWQDRDIAEGGVQDAPETYETTVFSSRDGEMLHASRFGSDADTTIIFLHGIASTSDALVNGALLLHQATGAEVITPDYRGHGRSSGRPYDVDYIGQYEDDLEDMIAAVLASNPSERVIIAGHSMGGGVAMRYALKDNAPVPTAYLLLAPNFGEGPAQRSGEDMDPDQADEAASFVHFDVRRMIGLIMLNSIGVTWLNQLPIMYFNVPPAVIEYSYRSVMSAQPIRPHTSDKALQAVTVPLLVVVGSDDEIFDVSAFPEFIRANSDGETIILPGLTHSSIYSDPATFEVVGEWYQSLP